MADDDGADAVIFVWFAFELEDNVEDGAGDLAWDAAGAGGEGLGGEAQWIRDRQAEARGADIYGEDTHARKQRFK